LLSTLVSLPIKITKVFLKIFVSVQVAILYYCGVSLSSVEISPCARWNPHGITVAGDGVVGNAPTQLTTPKGIFLIQRTNTLYVADFGNERVQMFSLNGPSSGAATTVASNIRAPSKIYVEDDEDGPTVYISVFIGNRVEKWTKGATQGIQLGGECRSCFGVAVDKEKNVYMSESDRHRVVKWSPLTNLTTPVAGQTDERGTTDEYLSAPDGIYFDRSSDTLYVADSGNSRIQKWKKDALSGIQVAGSNTSTPAEDAGSLVEPNGVWVDQQTKIVYVADTGNNRITRWLPDATVGDIIAGGKGMNQSVE
jgi:sugar lactone lactonase YvrE